MSKKTQVLDIQAQLRAELDTLKDRVEPPSGYMISTKAKTFTLPDGSADDGPLICVVLDWITANTYFKGIYNPKNIKPPVCWALGRKVTEVAASKNATDPQGTLCKDCKQNEWESDPGGGKGKACKNTRRLLVVPLNATAESSPWILSCSPTALKHFDKYVNTLSDTGVHPIEVITEISFEASEDYPSLRFKVDTKHDKVELMWALKEKGQAILFQEPNPEEKAA
jgi:hypothetical protein